MVPIFYSQQGTLKSTVIEAMAPLPEFYCTMDLADRDADLARRMRGRLVAELVELRGFFGREAEELKAFLSQKVDTWIPKFQEIAVTLPRRFLMFGSTNKNEVLVDETGNRRLLPAVVGQGDAARIARDRDQLWAEGAARFVADGVAWEEAEALARDVHADFMVYDDWQPQVAAWLASARDDSEAGAENGVWGASEFTTLDALVYAVGVDSRTVGRAESNRMTRILRMLGYESHVTKGEQRSSKRVWRPVYGRQAPLA
jgi:predicted P-loop ATPase